MLVYKHMMEGKNINNPMDNRWQQAEVVYSEAVKEAIEMDPFSISRPLKYAPGTVVWVAEVGENAKIQKGSAGIYLVESEDGTPALCLEASMSPIH